MVATSIQATERPIFKVFTDDYAFSIPRYQRPYLWGKEQAQQLLDDLLGAMEDNSQPVDDLDPYFLGSTVLVKQEQSPDSDVIDGQQRLATLTILLAALRARLPGQHADDLTTFIYEKGNPLIGTTNRYRMALRERDRDFFRSYIQEEGGLDQLQEMGDVILIDSQRNIRDNALYFRDRLSELPEESCRRLAKFTLRKAYLVMVSTPSLDSAYRIFTVLNDRGLDLSHTDILKAEVIGQIPEPEQDAYTKKWEEEEAELGRDQFGDLFSHIRMIYRKVKLRGTVLKEIRESVKPTSDPRGFIDDVLMPYASAFADIQGELYESVDKAEEVNQLFKLLKLVDNWDWYPPAILFLSCYRDKPHELARFLKDLERLAATMMIRRVNINDRIERYGQLLQAIEKKEDLYSVDSPLQLSADEKRQAREILEGDIYSIVPMRLPVLLRLDGELGGGDASYNFKTVTVEHVLPQNPAHDGEWMKLFPDEDERKQLTNCIGNLVLLPRRKNSQASNYDFARKKTEYFARGGISPFALTTDVLNSDKWTADVIRHRRDRLVAKLGEIWRL